MAMAKVANPGPAALWVLNPNKRGKKMATKRRRSTKRRTTRRRPTTVAAANPVRRRRRSTTRRRATVHASTGHHRRRNPSTRRRRRYARNPASGVIGKAVGIAGGMAALGLLSSFVPPIGGSSVFVVAARQAALGWGVGYGMKRFGILPAYADDVKLAGIALAAGTLINAYVMPTLSGFLRPAQTKQVAMGNKGMQDIVTLPRGSYDPYYGGTPMFATNSARGMNDIITIPRRAY